MRRAFVLALLFALTGCADKAVPPVSGCFMSPWLYCPAESNGDGD